MSTRISGDILVIGSGLAGGIAALKTAELGHKVILVEGRDSASRWAQGGIVYKAASDPQALINDILSAGAGLNYRPVVEFVASEGPRAVERWLIDKLQVPFDRTDAGGEDLSLEAAHSAPRILHVKDSTGAAIMRNVAAAVKDKSQIQCVAGSLVDILMSNRHDARQPSVFRPGRAMGAYVCLSTTGEIVPITARAVIVATGGFSQLYQHSTGPQTSRGDGISAGYRAGARTLHMEYVQFHPTALFVPDKPRRLLTEALRGAGAKLLNMEGKTFVDALASRDVVARGIHEELMRTGGLHVWLDLREVRQLDEKFPSMVDLLRQNGFDPHRDLIPVVPAAHYTVGGVWTDIRAATSVPGLYAAGEVSCTGLHGANRLASTSLLEAVVFGERAAESASNDLSLSDGFDFEPRPWRPEKGPVDPALLQQDWQFLKQTLWNYVGLVRSEHRLRRAERILVELRTEIESFYNKSALTEDLISLRHGVQVATLLLYSALRNRQSVGTHYLKEDY